MEERIILAVDTSDPGRASRLVGVAKDAGAKYVKMGLQLGGAIGWPRCSELAAGSGVGWVADAKLCDIPKTVSETVKNFGRLDHPPFGITMHVTSGRESMRQAQKAADRIRMLGVTVLTSIPEAETGEIFYDLPDDYDYGAGNPLTEAKVAKLARIAVESGLEGLVCSPLEVGAVKADPETRHLFAMVPSTRSPGVSGHDQSRKATPAEAIRDGADLLVIGRQITEAADPASAYSNLVEEITAVS